MKSKLIKPVPAEKILSGIVNIGIVALVTAAVNEITAEVIEILNELDIDIRDLELGDIIKLYEIAFYSKFPYFMR